MKIVIPGGSGQVGTILGRAFHGRGDDVVVLSRRAAARPWPVGRGLHAYGNLADPKKPPRRPVRLVEHGFSFRFPNWSDAARDLCDRWRVMASASSAA